MASNNIEIIIKIKLKFWQKHVDITFSHGLNSERFRDLRLKKVEVIMAPNFQVNAQFRSKSGKDAWSIQGGTECD